MAENAGPEKSITRRDLPTVVRRAAELAAFSDDAEEAISEDEVIRIASELGIAPRHVKQALYEGVQDEPEPTFLDKQFGTPRIMAVRAVPLPVEQTRRALEDYLTTYEYLTVVRRQSDSMTFEPAPDAVSKFARKFKRSRHQLASAEVVEISVRPLEEGWSHVRIRAVFKDDRKSQVVGAGVGGTILGGTAGGLTGAITGTLASTLTFLPTEAAVAVGSVFGVGIFAAVFTGILASARKRYRHWRERTVMQTEGVLDRLEKGDDMRPAPPPWIRRLQMRFGQL
jgi:hypothetical protein